MEVTQRGAAHDANDTRGHCEFFVPGSKWQFISVALEEGELESGLSEGGRVDPKQIAC